MEVELEYMGGGDDEAVWAFIREILLNQYLGKLNGFEEGQDVT